MANTSRGAPIKVGVLSDLPLPTTPQRDAWGDVMDTLALVFRDAHESGELDRPVELVLREAEGLPIGTVKSVIDAFEELVELGCLLVIGPNISENAIPLRPEIDRTFRVPAISVCGTEDWLGEWTFALPNGSMTDEPIVIAHLVAKAGWRTVGVLVERSIIGQQYARNFRTACRDAGLRITSEEAIAQTGLDITDAVRVIHTNKPDALVHLGFGYGVVRINEALDALDWHPPRFMGTAFEEAFYSTEIWKAFTGWTGLEQFDEGNPVAHQFLDRFEREHGRRPEYFAGPVFRDVAVAVARALANAEPLSPTGVRDALERVKMVPAASGVAGTTISFGKWTRRGWMGSGYLVGRTLDTDGHRTHLAGRFEPR